MKTNPIENKNTSEDKSLNQNLSDIFSYIKKISTFGNSILNGIIGDHLQKKDNILAVKMQFIHENNSLDITKESLKKIYPTPTSKISIIVHGLSCEETIWNFKDTEKTTTYGCLLQKDEGFTPFYLRYNTGLHISENGQKLSNLLTLLYKSYPVKIEEIIFITHSMGGLVTRSASYYGYKKRKSWIKKVSKIFFLGTPHQGAILEKFGNIVSNLLGTIQYPYIQLASKIINFRSSGIKDLRYGNIIDEDWKKKNPDDLLKNNKKTVPLLSKISYYFITGSITNKENIITKWIGDLLVTKSSATGYSENKNHHLDLEKNNHKEFPKVNHIKLTSSPEIYEQIKIWCGN